MCSVSEGRVEEGRDKEEEGGGGKLVKGAGKKSGRQGGGKGEEDELEEVRRGRKGVWRRGDRGDA